MKTLRPPPPVAIHVEASAGLVTIQDGGRWRAQRLGVSVGGAMDERAMALANALAGNPRDAALIEIGWGASLTLSFPQDAGLVLTGVGMEAQLATRRLALWSFHRMDAGSRLRCRVTEGRFGYLACSGGFDVPAVFGGRGADLRSGWGGVLGRVLRPGDRLTLGPGGIENPSRPRSLAPALRPEYRVNPTLRILPGSHWASVPEEGRGVFLTHPFVVTRMSDRMGYRLSGPAVYADPAFGVDSEPVTFGSIQLPPDGQPIVLMADRPTVGGYPRIGEVIRADLPLLAQLRPGDPLRFEAVDRAVAIRAQGGFERALTRLEIVLRG